MNRIKKIVTIAMTLILLVIPTATVFATESEGTIAPFNDNSFILPPGSESARIIKDEYSIDLPTGCGDAQCVINEHYYIADLGSGFLPAITVGMGTTVTADMGAEVEATDIFGFKTTLSHTASQTTSFYARAKTSFIQTQWASYSSEFWACDDEGDAIFYLVNHYEGFGFPD